MSLASDIPRSIASDLPKATSRERYRQEVLHTQISWEGIFGNLRPASSSRLGSPRPASPRQRERSPGGSPRARSPFGHDEFRGSIQLGMPQLSLFGASGASPRSNSTGRPSRSFVQEASPPGSPRPASYSAPSGGPGRFAFQGDRVTEKVTTCPSTISDESSPSRLVAPWAKAQDSARSSKQHFPRRGSTEGSLNGSGLLSQDSRSSPNVPEKLIAPWARDSDRWRRRPPESSRSGFSTPTMDPSIISDTRPPAGATRPVVASIDFFSDTASLDSLALSPRGTRSAQAVRAEGIGTNIFGRKVARDLQGSRGLWRDLPTYSTCGRWLECTGMDTEFPVHPSVRSRSGSPPGTPSQVSRSIFESGGLEMPAGMRPPKEQSVIRLEQAKSSTNARAIYTEHMNVSVDAVQETQHAACLSPRSPRSSYVEKSPRSHTEARALYEDHMNMNMHDSVSASEHSACLSPKGRYRSGTGDKSPRSRTEARWIYSEHMNMSSNRSDTEHDATLMSSPRHSSPRPRYRSLSVDNSPAWARPSLGVSSAGPSATPTHAESESTAPALPAWMTLPASSAASPPPSVLTPVPEKTTSLTRDALEKLEAWKSSRQGQREKLQPKPTGHDTPPSTPPTKGKLKDSWVPASFHEANCSPERRRDFHCPLNAQEVGRHKVQPNRGVHPISPRKAPVPVLSRARQEGKSSTSSTKTKSVNGSSRFKDGVLTPPNRRAG